MEYLKLTDSDERFILFEDDPQVKSPMSNKHYHNAFEIYLLEEGSCRYFIDDKSYDVQAGDLVLIPAKTIHRTFYGDEVHRRRLIYCSSHCIPSAVAEILPTLLYHYRCPEITETVKALFDRIRDEQNATDKYSSQAKLDYLRILFFTLARNTPVKLQAESSYVTEAVGYIKKNYNTSVRLTDIARLYGVSPEHLSRAFKRDTGFGFNEYLNMVRLQKADEMLKSDAHTSIAEIAYACGFNDSNYFSDKYKKIYGYPPTKSRLK